MKRKKGKFMTLLFSFIPGAAEMYMGFMKNGISIMTAFILCFVVPSVLRMSDVFNLFGVLLWFYGFFHARNFAACSEEELQSLPDEYIWASVLEGKEFKISNPALRKWGAIILIIYGISMLWHSVSSCIYYLIPEGMKEYVGTIMNEIPQVCIAVLIIIIGLKLVAGKKEELHEDGE